MQGVLAMLIAWTPAVTWDDSTGRCPASEAEPRLRAALPDDAEVEVDATVREADDGGLAVELEIRSGEASTTRSLQSPACETLVEAAALIASSSAATFQEVVRPAPEPDPEPEPVPESVPAPVPVPVSVSEPVPVPVSVSEPEPVPVPVPRPEPAPAPRSPPLLGAYVRAAAAAGFGLTPQFDAGGSLGAGLSIGEARIEAHAVVYAPTATDGSPNVLAWAWSLGLRGCGGWRPPNAQRLVVLGCGGVEAGELLGQARGSQLNSSTPQRTPWLGATVGPGLTVDLARFVRLVALADVVVSLRRSAFVISGPQQLVHRTAAVGPRAFLGVEVHFLGRN